MTLFGVVNSRLLFYFSTSLKLLSLIPNFSAVLDRRLLLTVRGILNIMKAYLISISHNWFLMFTNPIFTLLLMYQVALLICCYADRSKESVENQLERFSGAFGTYFIYFNGFFYSTKLPVNRIVGDVGMIQKLSVHRKMEISREIQTK